MPGSRIGTFEVGKLYSNEQIYRSLQVGNAGGVRSSLKRDGQVKRVVVMTSVATARQRSENPYHDRLEGDVLVYTAAGRQGDQSLGGQNSRLSQQLRDRFPVYCFMLMESRRKHSGSANRWTFVGMLAYLRSYREQQIDAAGKSRWTWVFEFKVCRDNPKVAVRREGAIAEEILLKAEQAHELNADDREIAAETVGESVAERLRIERVRSQLLGYDPRAFENLLQSLLIQSGFERVAVTKFSQDGGIDLNAYPGSSSWPIRDMLLQIQAKRWLHTVGRKEVAELRGSLSQHARGCVVTTSHFSRAAIAEASETGKSPIVLVDGHELAKIITHLGLTILHVDTPVATSVV